MSSVAFIGLGAMGYPMAGHLVRSGHTVTVFNRTAARAERWVSQHGGRCARTPEQAATGAEFVFACVGNDEDIREVTLGPRGAFAAMRPGTLFCDHTTASAQIARELESQGRECEFEVLDGPVSGGQSGAEKGQLTVMVGGSEHAFRRALPLLSCYSRVATWIGAPGSGQLAKAVNQICIAGLIQALAEGLHFGRCAGLDMERVLAAISKGAAQSWQMENRARSMLAGDFDFGFAVNWMRKDLGIALATARATGAQLPITALVDQLYAQVQTLGGGRWDTSSLISVLKPIAEAEQSERPE
jgi:3-hydroxyisobutyrate dehydrogenase